MQAADKAKAEVAFVYVHSPEEDGDDLETGIAFVRHFTKNLFIVAYNLEFLAFPKNLGCCR